MQEDLQTLTRGNGATTSYSYDGADRLTDLRTTVGSALRSDFTYQPDRLGQTLAVTETLALPSASPSDTPTATATSTNTATSTPMPGGTPAFVQVNSAVPQTDQSSVAATYTAGQSAGNTKVIVIGWNDSTATITSVVDSAGNTYQVAASLVRGSSLSQAIYYASNITAAGAGTNTVTVTFSQAAAYMDLRIVEYSGLATTGVLDTSAAAAGTGSGAGSGSLTTSAAGELLVGAGTTGGSFSGAGSGYTSRIITTPDADIVEDAVAGGGGSYDAPALLGASYTWVMQVVAFMTRRAT